MKKTMPQIRLPRTELPQFRVVLNGNTAFLYDGGDLLDTLSPVTVDTVGRLADVAAKHTRTRVVAYLYDIVPGIPSIK